MLEQRNVVLRLPLRQELCRLVSNLPTGPTEAENKEEADCKELRSALRVPQAVSMRMCVYGVRISSRMGAMSMDALDNLRSKPSFEQLANWEAGSASWTAGQ